MKNRSKHLLRLALADQAFREADAMIDHLLDGGFDPSSPLYHSCIAGVVTSYCRPFMSAEGLGSLSTKFQQFEESDDPPRCSEIHEDLLIARHKIFAHFDLDYGESEFHQKRYTLNPGEVELRLGLDGFDISTNLTTLPFNRLASAKKLVSFQLKRIQKCQTDFAMSVLKETKGQLGTIVFKPTRKGA